MISRESNSGTFNSTAMLPLVELVARFPFRFSESSYLFENDCKRCVVVAQMILDGSFSLVFLWFLIDSNV